MARLALYGEPKIDCIIWTSQTDNHGEPWISLETWAGQGWVTIPVGTGDKNGIKANPQEASISGVFFLKSFIQVIVFGHSMHLGGFSLRPESRLLQSSWQEALPSVACPEHLTRAYAAWHRWIFPMLCGST